MLCSKPSVKALGAISAFAVIAIALVFMIVPTSQALEVPEGTQDMGEFWGTTLKFVYSGEEAETIEWDFGDGSPVSNEWNPEHTYAAIGDYLVTQTVTNSYDGGSSAVGYYLVKVMGKPYVEIVGIEGSPEMDKVYATINTAPVKQANPSWDGYTFQGFYADPEHTVPFDWSQPLTGPVTAYAAWVAEGGNGGDDGDGGNETDAIELNGTIVIMGVVGIIAIIASAYTKQPIILVVGIAILALAAIGVIGIIDIPEILDGFKGVRL